MSGYGKIHVPALTKIAIGYAAAQKTIADIVIPRISVAKETDRYTVFGREEFAVDRDDVRANGAVAKRTTWKIESQPTYVCDEHAREIPYTERDLKNADSEILIRARNTTIVTRNVMLSREFRAQALLRNTANWANSTTLTGTDQYDNANFAGDFEADVDTAKAAIRTEFGANPTHVIIPEGVSRYVKKLTAVRDLIKYTHTGLLKDAALPDMLWGLKVLQPESIYNSANSGQSFAGADIWGKDIVFLFVNSIPSQQEPTATLTFEARKFMVEEYRDDAISGWYIRAGEIVTEKIISSLCGYVIKDAVS